MIRLLTDGGYPSLFNYVGELFPIDKRGHLYYIRVKGKEYVFFPDEVEIVTVFYEDNVGKQLITVSTVVVITAIAITIIISVIF
jgi:hypothetical protein